MIDFIKNLPFDLTFIDWFLGAFLLIATVHGLARGLLKESLTPVVWLSAVFLAFRFAYVIEPFLAPWIANSIIRLAIAGVAMGMLLVMIGSLLVSLLSNFFNSHGLGSVNRLFGLLFGLAWGSTALIVSIGILETSLGEAQWWRDSKIITVLKPYEAIVSEAFWQLVETYKQHLDVAKSN